MSMTKTITEIAQYVMQEFGRPASVEKIYAEIIRQNLYTFNTLKPERLLRTAIHRQT